MYDIYLLKYDERALLFRDGKLVAYLGPGKHRYFGFGERELVKLDPSRGAQAIDPALPLADFLRPEDGIIVDVPANQVGLVTRDERADRILMPGRYLVWRIGARVDVQFVDLEPLDSQIPLDFRVFAHAGILMDVAIHQHEVGLLYVDGAFARPLAPGRHALSMWQRQLRVERVDMRERELQVVGQELMTRDKVSLRLNLIAKFRVRDAVLASEALKSINDAVYAEAQLAARAVVAGVDVDTLLEKRLELSEQMQGLVRERAKAWGLELIRVDVKDVVLPGDMRVLFNQVIEAEKRAAAQVIARREEVAATRSLANTARLLEQNPVLLRLKEIEALKEVVAQVPNLTVVLGADDIQKQLRLGATN